MREIKFRIWDEDNSLMSYDYNFNNLEDLKYKISNIEDYFGRNYIDDNKNYLMQSTGLFDKNKKEIYDGDLLQYSFEDGENKPFKVVWNNFGWGFIYVNWENPSPLGSFQIKKATVIGNIIENPELFKI